MTKTFLVTIVRVVKAGSPQEALAKAKFHIHLDDPNNKEESVKAIGLISLNSLKKEETK